MALFRNWKKAASLCLLIAVVVLIGTIAWLLHPKVQKEQLASPDGNVALEVCQRSGEDAFEWKHIKGPDWSGTTSLNDVTEFQQGTFSSDSRHLILVFTGADGKEQYQWTDYETGLSGGLPLEISCKDEGNFAASIKKEGVWKDISFRFLGWHSKENWALFAYEMTTAADSVESGYFWYDLEARYKENAVYVKELPLY